MSEEHIIPAPPEGWDDHEPACPSCGLIFEKEQLDEWVGWLLDNWEDEHGQFLRLSY